MTSDADTNIHDPDPNDIDPVSHDTVLVVDFGAQYAQLIARRVRELSVFSEIVPHRITAAQVRDKAPSAIILSGGPASVNIEGTPRLDPEIYDLGIPIFGICYGAQLVALQLGGTVARTDRAEYGRTPLDVTHPDANKGQVVQYLAAERGISTEAVATLGDMPNDVLMFAHSGVSIAMGNASLEVQRAARHVTGRNDADGFAEAIDRFVLGAS